MCWEKLIKTRRFVLYNGAKIFRNLVLKYFFVGKNTGEQLINIVRSNLKAGFLTRIAIKNVCDFKYFFNSIGIFLVYPFDNWLI